MSALHFSRRRKKNLRSRLGIHSILLVRSCNRDRNDSNSWYFSFQLKLRQQWRGTPRPISSITITGMEWTRRRRSRDEWNSSWHIETRLRLRQRLVNCYKCTRSSCAVDGCSTVLTNVDSYAYDSSKCYYARRCMQCGSCKSIGVCKRQQEQHQTHINITNKEWKA